MHTLLGPTSTLHCTVLSLAVTWKSRVCCYDVVHGLIATANSASLLFTMQQRSAIKVCALRDTMLLLCD